VERFIAHHAGAVIGTLSGFDRLVFRGTLRSLAHHLGMSVYLSAMRVLLKDFARYAMGLSEQLKEVSQALACETGRPIRYLASGATSKESVAREIAAADGIEQGLICVLRSVELCWSYQIVRNPQSRRLELQPRLRKCLYLYHYSIDPILGFMNARIQTWFPFSIQVCVNGREWLARQMDAAGLAYTRRDNCFTWLEDPRRAQQLMDKQVEAAWPALLDGIARQLNPRHETMFAAYPIEYYWSVHQSEWATDVMFRDTASLSALYPKLVHHGLTTFFSPDVMRFLGRKVSISGRLPPGLKADVVSDLRTRPEGVRIKHRLGANSLKMYDKQGSVLRIEATINHPADFKSFRAPEGKPDAPKAWHGMRKGISDLHRRTEISQAANQRYLQALASVDDSRSLGELTTRLCQPVICNGRRFRPLNPHAPGDAELIAAISHGEFALNGFRNRDLRRLLFADGGASQHEQRRHAAAVSRRLALLRAHGLIKKVPTTHRYHLSAEGRVIVTALLTAANTSIKTLTKLAA
jgi:hypothetical protein